MRKPLNRNYQVARKLLTGAADPAALKLQYDVDGNCVMSHIRPLNHGMSHTSLLPAGFIANIIEDAMHAGLAGLKNRIGLLREMNIKYFKPAYTKDHFRIDVTIAQSAPQKDIRKLRVNIIDSRDQVCIEGVGQLYCLSRAQVERMFPNTQIPRELANLLP